MSGLRWFVDFLRIIEDRITGKGSMNSGEKNECNRMWWRENIERKELEEVGSEWRRVGKISGMVRAFKKIAGSMMRMTSGNSRQ